MFPTKKIISVTVILFIPLQLFCQFTGSIKGIVKENGKPVEFANVYLTSKTDTIKVISGTTTDSLGFFNIDKIAFGNYVLNTHSLGYKPYKENISVNESNNKIDLKTIEVKPDNIVLQSVNIVSFRKSIKRTEQGIVIEANDNIAQASGNAADLLKNMPTVQVDADGGISIRGKSPLILINGKVSGLTGVDRTAQLERIPATFIERIEINNNPSAKYDADAEAGIINIVLKENIEFGTNGSFSLGLGYGVKERLNGSLMLNHNTGKWNLGLYYNNWYTMRTRSVNGDRTNYSLPDEYYLIQRRNDNRTVKNQELRLNTDFKPNKQNRFSFNNAWEYNEQDNSETLTSTNETQTHNFNNRNTRHSLEIRKFNAFESELNYIRNFNKEGQSLTANIISSFDDEKENTNIDVKKQASDFSQIGNVQLERTGSYLFSNMTNLAIDYKQPISNIGTIETGYKSILRYLDADYKTFSFSNNDYLLNPLRSNIYKFNEQIHALYVQYLGWFGDKQQPAFKYDGGIRAEQVYSTGNNTNNTEPIKNNYLNFFPSANIAYYPKSFYFFRLSYSRRINRPNLGDLNPFIDITDSLNQHGGNPYLKPELIHSFELSFNRDWQTSSFSLASFYRHNSNSIMSYSYSLGNGAYLLKPINIGNTINYGFEGVYSLNYFKAWSLNSSFSIYKTEISGITDQISIKNNVVVWYAKLINSFMLWKNCKLQVTANYTSPVAIPQGKRLEVFFVDMGFQQKLFKNKGRLGIVFTDVFKTQQSGSITSGDNFYFHRISKIDSRAVLVTFAYTFGSTVDEKLMENKFKNE